MAIVLNALAVDGTTGKLLGVETGTGVLANGRDSERYAWSDEDLAYSVPAYAAAWNGGRPVQNLVTASEDLTNATWAHTATTDSAVLVTFGASGQYISEDIATTEGHTYILSFWVRNVTGNTTMQARHNNSATGNTTAITIDGTLKRYSFIVLGRTGDGNVSFGLQDDSGSGWGQAEFTKIQVEDVTGRADMTVPSEYVSNGVAYGDEILTNWNFDTATGWAYPTDTSITGGQMIKTGGAAGYITYTENKLRNGKTYAITFSGTVDAGTMEISGSWSDQSPSQYVSAPGTYYAIFTGSNKLYFYASSDDEFTWDSISIKETTTGYAVYGTENGNSVASNVVTEGVGAALSPVPRLSYCPAATSSLFASNDLTGWTKLASGMTGTTTFTATGLTGSPNTATSIDITSGGGAGTYYGHRKDVSITANTRVTAVVYVPKSSDAKWYAVAFWFASDNSKRYQIAIRDTDGSVYEAYTNPTTYGYEVVDMVHSWRISFTAVDEWSSSSVTVFAFAKFNDQTVTSGWVGKTEYQNYELYKEKDIKEVRGLPPIFTTAAAVSTTADDYTFDITNHSNTIGTYTCEWTPSYATSEVSGDLEIVSLTTAAGLLYYDGTNGDVESTDGTNTSTKAETIVAGTTYDLEVDYSTSGNSLQTSVDTVAGSAESYDGGFTTGTEIVLFRNNAYANELFALVFDDGAGGTSIPVFMHHYTKNIG